MLVDRTEMAAMLKVHVRTFDRIRRQIKIPVVMVGRRARFNPEVVINALPKKREGNVK